MKRFKYIIFPIVSFILILTGCAPQKYLTREESLALRNKQIEDTTRIYSGVSKEDVLIAVDSLFRLADGNDFKITHTENSVIGERHWSVYLVLAASFGQDRWIVATEENQKDKTVKVIVRVTSIGSPVIPMIGATNSGTMSSSVLALPGVESTIPGDALYYIFFHRLEYLLEKRDQWLDCKEADDVIKKANLTGSIECLCNSFNMNDSRPDLYGKRMIFNKSELFYTDSVTKDEALILGNYLVKSGFFSGERKTVQVNKTGVVYSFRMVVKSGMENDERMVAVFKSFSLELSRNVFNGSMVDIHLCDTKLKTIKTITPL